MIPMDIANGFIFGTGVGFNDLRPLNITLSEQLINFDSDLLIGNGISIEDYVSGYEYKQEILLNITPGYFYLGDRECYCYSNKATQLSRVTQTPSGQIIPLVLQPDGISPVNLDLFTAGRVPERYSDTCGAAPIIVRCHDSGSISQFNIPFDTVISSETGISGELGYRIDPIMSGIIPGELTEYPWYFSPLERFAKCYDYWRNDLILSPDEYTYNIRTNSVELLVSGNPDSEYIVEYELNNAPFAADIDFNPIRTVPGDYVVCLSPNAVSVSETADSIHISLSQVNACNETIQVVAEVVSALGNPVSDVTITFQLQHPQLTVNGSGMLNVSGEPYLFVSGVVYDRFAAGFGDIVENNVLLADFTRINGNADVVVRSGGYLYPNNIVPIMADGKLIHPSSNYGFTITATTDAYGKAYANYASPVRNASDFNVRVVASTGSLSAYSDIKIVGSGEKSSLSEYASVYYRQMIVRSLNHNVPIHIEVPEDCISPSSMMIEIVDSQVEALTSARLTFEYQPDDIVIYDGKIAASYNLISNNHLYILRYMADPGIKMLDQRSTYVV